MSDFTTPKLIPPFRFAIVEEGVFRGAYPTEKNCRFLRRYLYSFFSSILFYLFVLSFI
jgi:hypothetical protein